LAVSVFKTFVAGEVLTASDLNSSLTTITNGQVCIPNMAFVRGLHAVATMLGHQIPGRGKNTYTKHFKGGVSVFDVPLLTKNGKEPILVDDVEGIRYFVPSDGRSGGGRRVWRRFPEIPQWQTSVQFVIMDETITRDVFEEHLYEAGRFIGIGRFRPQNGGWFGRFTPTKFSWEVREPGSAKRSAR